MSRRAWWCYESMRILEQQMGKPILFFKEARMTNPVLSFNGVELEPYWEEKTERGWNLYYPPGTTTPVDPGAWPRQLERQGWRQVRCGVEPDGSVMVVCERMQS